MDSLLPEEAQNPANWAPGKIWEIKQARRHLKRHARLLASGGIGGGAAIVNTPGLFWPNLQIQRDNDLLKEVKTMRKKEMSERIIALESALRETNSNLRVLEKSLNWHIDKEVIGEFYMSGKFYPIRRNDIKDRHPNGSIKIDKPPFPNDGGWLKQDEFFMYNDVYNEQRDQLINADKGKGEEDDG